MTMTLIVGIKCRDGVVLAADGAATLGVMGQNTVRQSTKKKLRIIDNSLVLGVSGPVGLGQRFAGMYEDLWKEKVFSDSYTGNRVNRPLTAPHVAMESLRVEMWRIIELEAKIVHASSQLFGTRHGLAQVLSSTVLALPIGGKACLFQFDEKASPEEVTESLPFVAIGSGQIIADPFLAFIRRLFWSDSLPVISEGIFHAVWTIRHAIETNPGGIGEPIQVVKLHNNGRRFIAEELEDDVETSKQMIVNAEEQMRTTFRLASASGTTATPPPQIK